MSLVRAQILGGAVKPLDVDTVADARRELNANGYTAMVNNRPADDSQTLNDSDFVLFSTAVKGGNN